MQERLLRISLLLIFSLFFQFSIGQNANPYYNFKHLNVQNGLVQNIVYHFLQDSRGYIWLGTRNGITVFDGIRTINFQHANQNKNTLAGNFITRILEDSDHVVWIGNDAGIDRFNKSDNSFTHFALPAPAGLKADSYCVPLGFSNAYDLWFIDTRSRSLNIFNTKRKDFRTMAATDAVDGALTIDPVSGRVHIWTYLSIGSTHFIFNQDSLIHQDHYFDGNKKSDQPPMLIYHVYHKNDSTAWLATAKGLMELNAKTNGYKLYNRLNGEPVNEVRYISESPKGILWVGTGTSGMYTFDPKGKTFVDHFRYEALDPLSICSNNIISLYFDRVGNIWCGSYGNGISYAHVENNFFSKFLSKDEMARWKKENNISWTGADHDGKIWCMVQDVQGFWQLDSDLKPKSFHRPVLENGKPFIGSVYEILFNDHSTAWCTTDRGLFRYNTVSNSIKQVEYHQLSTALFGSYWSKVIIRLHDGSALFSTFGGVFRISTQNRRESIEAVPALISRSAGAFDMLYEDTENNLYVTDTGDSLFILSPEKENGNYRVKKALAFHPEVFQMQDSGSNIYLATDAGLFLLNKKTLLLEKSPINELLPFVSINNLLVEKNKIWLFGDKGLYYYNTAEKTGRLFTTEDGLPSNEFNEYTLLLTSSENCIAGTSNGLLTFRPERLLDTIYPPRAQLINMYVNDSSTGFLPNPQETSKIVLAHDQNTFSFDFSCIGFHHAEESLYEYKLDSYDDHWIKGGTTHYTRYSKIAPGNYLFQVRTTDANRRVSPYTKTLAIEIKKAFWQTNLFRTLMVAVFGLILWLLVKWYLNTRIRKQLLEFERRQAIEKERTRIATDMHDDLGAGLSRIKFLSETIAMKKQQQLPVDEDITSISNYANEMIGKMGEIVWALNEKNDSLSDLLSYTRAYAVEYLLSNGIHCQVNVPAEFPSLFVNGEFRRNVYLAIKEALHNIIKHAKAENVVITIMIDKNLTFAIRDDGVGFDINNIRPFSNGLNNMQKRMKDIQGNLEIVQSKGTSIIISAPLPV